MDDDQIMRNASPAKACARSPSHKSQGCSVAQVNQVIDAWANQTIDDQLRKRSLCLELKRLAQLMEVFYQRASRTPTCKAACWSPSLSSDGA